MSDWRRYDSHLIPAFHERFEERWGKGTAPFLDPEAHEEPLPARTVDQPRNRCGPGRCAHLERGRAPAPFVRRLLFASGRRYLGAPPRLHRVP